MKIKELLELCKNDYCSISVYDKSTYTNKLFHHTQEVISKFGYYSLISWELDGNILKITTQTEF